MRYITKENSFILSFLHCLDSGNLFVILLLLFIFILALLAWDAVVWGEVSCTLYLKYSIFVAFSRVWTSNWVCKNAFDQYEWCCGHHSCLPSKNNVFKIEECSILKK